MIPQHEADRIRREAEELHKTGNCRNTTAYIQGATAEYLRYQPVVEAAEKMKKALMSLSLSVTAHPDYTGEENDEWTDLTEIANEAMQQYRAALNQLNQQP